MSRRTKLICVIVALVAMGGFIAAWPLYKKYSLKAVSASVMDRTKKAVAEHPELKPDWDKAMEDGVLTWPEAKSILEKAGEKTEPEE